MSPTRLATLLLVVILAVVAGCTSNVATCNSNAQGFVDKGVTWKVRTTPPTEQMTSAVSKLSRDFFGLKKVDAVWLENENDTSQLAVCTIVKCPMSFFVYAPGGLEKEPIEFRVSATCPGDF